MAQQPRGLILVTGPTGSGKSTTLAAMIEHINQNSDRHIITIEDPDVILVGEMRDYETISAALLAAETGHLVLSTLQEGRHRQWNVLLMPARPAARIRSESSWPLL